MSQHFRAGLTVRNASRRGQGYIASDVIAKLVRAMEPQSHRAGNCDGSGNNGGGHRSSQRHAGSRERQL
uniref:Uncharacterized protein n=1 Tax=uncultured marine virus TaxID=186617 RepID=A0A0F7L2X2_9VIRU|nr:hypothetical protein [uncultured marine virus]